MPQHGTAPLLLYPKCMGGPSGPCSHRKHTRLIQGLAGQLSFRGHSRSVCRNVLNASGVSIAGTVAWACMLKVIWLLA